MKKLQSNPTKGLTCALLVIVALGLGACANPHWNRAFYEGAQMSAQQCRTNARPDRAPCPELPTPTDYERERQALTHRPSTPP